MEHEDTFVDSRSSIRKFLWPKSMCLPKQSGADVKFAVAPRDDGCISMVPIADLEDT